MKTTELAIRVDPENPNHHLWCNNGTWFIHYTVYPDELTAERIRASLKSRCLATARRRRDATLRRHRCRAVGCTGEQRDTRSSSQRPAEPRWSHGLHGGSRSRLERSCAAQRDAA